MLFVSQYLLFSVCFLETRGTNFFAFDLLLLGHYSSFKLQQFNINEMG